MDNTLLKKPRGFAAMSREDHHAASRKGGATVQALDIGHRFRTGAKDARAAGRLGGLARAAKLKGPRDA